MVEARGEEMCESGVGWWALGGRREYGDDEASGHLLRMGRAYRGNHIGFGLATI